MGFWSVVEILNKVFDPQGALRIVSGSSSDYTKRFDYDANGNVIYIGLAKPGAATSETKWQIRKLEYDANGNVIAELFADGSAAFDKVWDNRTLYTYGQAPV